MKNPYVIAINSVSGGGKTALAEIVASSLSDAVLFRFDDFDESNLYPEDFCKADISDFDCPGMAAAVQREIDHGAAAFVVLDYPFGRDHPRFEKEIDLSVFIDTPLDVAMGRRILRDFCSSVAGSAEERLFALKNDLTHYIAKARHPYLEHYRHKDTSDLVLDGCFRLDQLRDQVLERVETEQHAGLTQTQWTPHSEIKQMTPTQKLAKLGYSLPALPAPSGRYTHTVRTGNLVFLAGKGIGRFT